MAENSESIPEQKNKEEIQNFEINELKLKV